MADDSKASLNLVVGLGNPGEKYSHTRHNIGFDVVDALCRRWQIALRENRKFKGEYGDGVAIAAKRIALLKPQTFMNRSGQSVRAVMDWYKFEPASILVIYDDMDLQLGRLRLRLSGSAGGHNGMKSIISHLGSQEFPRLRIGIGSTNENGGDRSQAVIGHVLGKFTPDEKKMVPTTIDRAVDAVEMALREDFEKAMNIFNGSSVLP